MNDEGALARRPRQVEHEPLREYHDDRLISLADVPSIACPCPPHLAAACAREDRCQDTWVALDDFALHPRRPEPA